MSELPAGTFTRQLFLGETLDADHIEADCNAGWLPSPSRSWMRPSLASSSSPPTSTISSCAAALSPEPHPSVFEAGSGPAPVVLGWMRTLQRLLGQFPRAAALGAARRGRIRKDASVWAWLSVVCSTSASSVALPRISSSVKAAAPSGRRSPGCCRSSWSALARCPALSHLGLSELQGWRGRVVSWHPPRKDKQYETQETAHDPRLGRRRLRPQHGHRLRRGERGNDQPPDDDCPVVQRVDEHYNAPVPEHGGLVRFLQLQRQLQRVKLSQGALPGRPAVAGMGG